MLRIFVFIGTALLTTACAQVQKNFQESQARRQACDTAQQAEKSALLSTRVQIMNEIQSVNEKGVLNTEDQRALSQAEASRQAALAAAKARRDSYVKQQQTLSTAAGKDSMQARLAKLNDEIALLEAQELSRNFKPDPKAVVQKLRSLSADLQSTNRKLEQVTDYQWRERCLAHH